MWCCELCVSKPGRWCLDVPALPCTQEVSAQCFWAGSATARMQERRRQAAVTSPCTRIGKGRRHQRPSPSFLLCLLSHSALLGQKQHPGTLLAAPRAVMAALNWASARPEAAGWILPPTPSPCSYFGTNPVFFSRRRHPDAHRAGLPGRGDHAAGAGGGAERRRVPRVPLAPQARAGADGLQRCAAERGALPRSLRRYGAALGSEQSPDGEGSG